jgi:non-ribosomal peptide synthetase component F
LHRRHAVTTESIHRVIELHAATRGDLVAIAGPNRDCSYRELNYGANALARHLMASGFRRGRHARVTMPRGIDLATALLAILKAGGSYSWSDPERDQDCIGSSEPHGVSIETGVDGAETRYLYLDVRRLLAERVSSCPNLPIVTRHTDIACVLHQSGAAAVMVPHATITALRARAVTHPTRWTGEPGAFALWMALMAGTTALLDASAEASAPRENQTAATAAA